ncbi:armadillo-type protein [Lipomyces japonicus]|uniref:armadillo-type protein n=1 Tax=Lipomyces japonicus TaxID=56871 RepID=UPI0034CD6F1B
MDFLKSAINTIAAKANSAFPYSIGDRIDFHNDTIWQVNDGFRRNDNLPVTVFRFDVNVNKSRLILAKNAVKKLRTLRFPSVIKVLDIYESDSEILIATEHVVPLDLALQKRETLNNDIIRWGLYAIAVTIKFINVDASSIHGNVRTSSIFISDSGEWKLSGFEVLTSTKDEEPVIYTFGGLLPDSARYASPEVVKSGWDVLKKAPHHLYDSWLYGCLIYEIFNGRLTTSDQLQSSIRKQIPADLFGPFKRLVQPIPKQRVSVKQFVEVGRDNNSKATNNLGAGFFKSDLIDLSENLDNLGVQNEHERQAFLRELQKLKSRFPQSYLRLKILPELVKCLEFSGGGPNVLVVLLDFASFLSQEEYQSAVAPTIVKLFSVPDRAIRLALLESLSKFIELLPAKTVNDKIFPDLLTGFTDVAPVIREQTVKAVLVIVPKLSDRNINNDLLRHLAKAQNDEQPGIRTNTTICLGKIAHNLGPHTRSRVLITAFSRSLRDSFVHARSAALLALAVTVDIFSPDDCATKILPAICPALLDKEKLVRTQAQKTLDVYIAKVKDHAASIPDQSALSAPVSSSLSSSPSPSKPVEENGAWSINGFAKQFVSGNLEAGFPVLQERQNGGVHLADQPAPLTVEQPNRSSSFNFAPDNKVEADDNNEDDDFGWGDLDDGDENIANSNTSANINDDWAAFDEPKPKPAVAPVRNTKPLNTTSTKSNINNNVTSTSHRTIKSHSIAAHKKKKELLFADEGAGEDDGWGDGW